MEMHLTEPLEEQVSETPEDVAILYSWANLQGARYRDFSASRREYRAQVRHRAAEDLRQSELRAKQEAEAAAAEAERIAREAERAAHASNLHASPIERERSLNQAREAMRRAAAERVEARRRAEAAAAAEAAAQREEREIAEAHTSAERQAARWNDADPGRWGQAATSRAGAVRARVPSLRGDPYEVPPGAHMDPDLLPPRRTVEYTELDDDAEALQGAFGGRQPSGERHASTDRDTLAGGLQGLTNTPQPIAAEPGGRPDEQPGRAEFHPGTERNGLTRNGTFLTEGGPTPDRNGHQGTPHEPARLEVVRPDVSRPAHSRSSLAHSDVFGLDPLHPDRALTAKSQPEPTKPAAGSLQRSLEPDGRRPRGFRPDHASGIHPAYRAPGGEPPALRSRISPDDPALMTSPGGTAAARAGLEPELVQQYAQAFPPSSTSTPGFRSSSAFNRSSASAAVREENVFESALSQAPDRSAEPDQNRAPEPTPERAFDRAYGTAPAWLYGSHPAREPAAGTPLRAAPLAPRPTDTLQQSRERVASRWFALKGVFEAETGSAAVAAVQSGAVRAPLLAIFSLSGGVGKTSLVATLGRTLSSLGEKVLLADTTSHGLLPYYFGATELKPGVVRTFSPPSGSSDAPIHLVSYDTASQTTGQGSTISNATSTTLTSQAAASETANVHAGISQSASTLDGQHSRQQAFAQQALAEKVLKSATGLERMLIDFHAGSGWLMRRFARMAETVLIPLVPDMNSVISLQTVERYFEGLVDQQGEPLTPFYLLNQFDASLALHLDVREVLRRQLGERLLPFVIRRSPAVSEALAEGMTVIDYQPESPICEDFLNVATWLRGVAKPAAQGFRTTRWSER